MPRPPRVEDDPDIDDEFSNPPPLEADDRPATAPPAPESGIAGSDPRMHPRMLARTPNSGNAAPLATSDARKQRLRRRVKAPRQSKDQLNGRIPVFLIDAVRDWCDKEGITEIGEGMTILVETGLNVTDAAVVPDAYADWCVETGFYPDRDTAKERYASGESQ